MKKKGFTLIELLAVIVILAVIALIATPTILGVIDKAKQGAADSSALGYIDAVEKQVMMNQVKNENKISDGTYDVPMSGVSVKGSAPTSGWLVLEKGEVTNYSFVINGYVVTKGSDTVKGDTATTRPEGGVASVLPAGLTKGTAVYINPETKTTCSETDAVSTTGTKAGCMKWYVYKDNGDGTYQLILDHNTTARVMYNKENNNENMDDTMKKELTDLVSVYGWKVAPRLITADEVAIITGANESPYKFNGKTSTSVANFYFDTNTTSRDTTLTSTKKSKYYWLFDNTYQCTGGSIEFGCKMADNNKYININNNLSEYIYGYWTSTKTNNSSSDMWKVDRIGCLSISSANVSGYGLRPVITL